MTGRWKDRWKIRNLLADEGAVRALLDLLSSTDGGKWVPVKNDEVSAATDAELPAWEQTADAGELGAGEARALFLPTPYFMGSAGEK